MSKREFNTSPLVPPLQPIGQPPFEARPRVGDNVAFAQFAKKSLAPEIRAAGVHHPATPKCPSHWEYRRRNVLLVLSENVLLLPTDRSTAHVLDAWPLSKRGALRRKILSVSWLPEEPWLPPHIAKLSLRECLEALFPEEGESATFAQSPACLQQQEAESSATVRRQVLARTAPTISAHARTAESRCKFCSPAEPILDLHSPWRRAPYSGLIVYDDRGPVPRDPRTKSLVETAFRLAQISLPPKAFQPNKKRSASMLPKICPEVWVDKERAAKVDYMGAVRAVSLKYRDARL